jgi:hypothetical protein
MASWDYEPVSVPVARGGERHAELGVRTEEGQVDGPAEPHAEHREEVSAVPTWFGETPKKTK